VAAKSVCPKRGVLNKGVLLSDPPSALGLSIESVTESIGGEAKITKGEGTQATKISLMRSRSFERRHQGDPNGGKVVYRILIDRVMTSASGEASQHPSLLEGFTLNAMKGNDGKWLFTPESGNIQGDAVTEVELLEAFENRRWMPGRVVEVGDSWPFTPGFIQGTLRKDLRSAKASGLMKLIAVQKLEDGTRQAVIECSITGGGREERGVAQVAAAQLSLSGKVVVNIDRPGIIVCNLSGRMASGVKSGTTEKEVEMPVSLKLKISPLTK
jgi:hypothetical protein